MNKNPVCSYFQILADSDGQQVLVTAYQAVN
jgi:hypothetical protein